MPTPRTHEELQRAAAEAEAWLDGLDPSAVEVDDTRDLRAISAAVIQVADRERALRDAVAKARAHGRSWGRIGMALGVSKQAALQRFGNSTHAPSPRRRDSGGDDGAAAARHLDQHLAGPGRGTSTSTRSGARCHSRIRSPASSPSSDGPSAP